MYAASGILILCRWQSYALAKGKLKRIPIKWVLQNYKREFTEVSVVLLQCTTELGETINY
jgi:hypothetical protein